VTPAKTEAFTQKRNQAEFSGDEFGIGRGHTANAYLLQSSLIRG
jgi:hypothetical protein